MRVFCSSLFVVLWWCLGCLDRFVYCMTMWASCFFYFLLVFYPLFVCCCYVLCLLLFVLSRGSIGNSLSTSFEVVVWTAYILPSPDPTWWDYTGFVVVVVDVFLV